MNFRTLAAISLLVSPFVSYAQSGGRGGRQQYQAQPVQILQESSTLSVFSEDGDRFFLILNGVNQNNIPQAKIRVENLPQYGNDVQIVFADNRMQPIRRRINIADPVDGKAVNMTLKIERGRNGLQRLKFSRCSEVEKNYHGPRDEFVMYYGKPQQINTVTETTYTDPITGRQVTQTTTTTTDGYNNNFTPPPPQGPRAMDQATFNDVRQSINAASFENTKLSTAKTIVGQNYITTSQLMELCNLFSFENTKLDFAKYAFDRTVDQNNFYKVASVLSFDANKQALNEFINGRR